jgi:hypothetical protein
VAQKESGHDEFCWRRSSPALSAREVKEVCNEVWSREGVDEHAKSLATSRRPRAAKQVLARCVAACRMAAPAAVAVHPPLFRHCSHDYLPLSDFL